MRLKSLKVFGFKTFAEATTLEFIPGITAVVGPNGSGKSNLVDAIRWVLGEQSSRSLRSQKMEDVIFSGNRTRKPLGMAEVTLTFDNDDGRLPLEYAQVAITRRAYRVGESEYFINRNHVRLRDVVELLMGTGLGPGSYAIVSQGQIDAILSSKPTERRSLFEETSGIAKFLARKGEALRRLEGTEQNAIRVNDLLAELERRVPELETQVRRAKRYRKVAARVRDLEILSFVRATASRRTERERVASELTELDRARDDAATRTATLGAQLAALRNDAYALDLALDTQRTQAQQARAGLARCEAEAAALVARRDSLAAQLSSTSADHERDAADRETLRAAIVQLDERLAQQTPRADTARAAEAVAARAVAAARVRLDAVYGDLRAIEAAAAQRAAGDAERRAATASTRAECERLGGEIARDAAARAVHERAERDAREGAAQAAAHAAGLEAEALAQRERAAQAAAAGEAATQRIAEHQTRARTLANELASSEAKLHTIEELEATLEGHVPGTRAVVEATERGELRGLHGVVSNLIAVDEAYARALDVAFGAGLSNLVTATSEDAERAVSYLRERELGRATFLPLDTLGGREGHRLGALNGRPGIVGYAHTLVRTAPQYAGIVAFLVGRILIVDVLPTGVRLVRGEGFRDSIVTLDGEQILGGGAITGGRYRRERSILGRRAQAGALRERIPVLRAELDAIERETRTAREAHAAAAAERDAAIGAAGRAEAALRETRARSASLEAEAARLARERAAAAQRAAELAVALATARERLTALEATADEHVDFGDRRAQLEAQLAAARTEIERAEGEHAAAAAAATAEREATAALAVQREGALTRLGLLDRNAERAGTVRETVEAELGELGGRLAALDARTGAARLAATAADAAVDAARREREARGDAAAQCEAAERIATRDEREATAAGEARRRRLAEIDAELGMLETSFAQHPADDAEQADIVARYRAEPDGVIDELPRLRDELARLVNVNLNADADLEELAARDAFLRAQLDDLTRARETLLATVAEIEAACQTVFNETFDAVRTEFAAMFARLFPGGEAKMWQTHPDRLSETGIEIAVAPPGKKMTALPALSGGERAMTAAALIFALIRVKPSPFYLLDEVDAALDDANVDRLSAMIREVATAAQIVVVTHNKKTMELASRMYGVTMAEPGISSIVSASLDDSPAAAPSSDVLEAAGVA